MHYNIILGNMKKYKKYLIIGYRFGEHYRMPKIRGMLNGGINWGGDWRCLKGILWAIGRNVLRELSKVIRVFRRSFKNSGLSIRN